MVKKNTTEVKKIRITADYDVDKCVIGKDNVMKCGATDSSEDSTKLQKE